MLCLQEIGCLCFCLLHKQICNALYTHTHTHTRTHKHLFLFFPRCFPSHQPEEPNTPTHTHTQHQALTALTGVLLEEKLLPGSHCARPLPASLLCCSTCSSGLGVCQKDTYPVKAAFPTLLSLLGGAPYRFCGVVC